MGEPNSVLREHRKEPRLQHGVTLMVLKVKVKMKKQCLMATESSEENDESEEVTLEYLLILLLSHKTI